MKQRTRIEENIYYFKQIHIKNQKNEMRWKYVFGWKSNTENSIHDNLTENQKEGKEEKKGKREEEEEWESIHISRSDREKFCPRVVFLLMCWKGSALCLG